MKPLKRKPLQKIQTVKPLKLWFRVEGRGALLSPSLDDDDILTSLEGCKQIHLRLKYVKIWFHLVVNPSRMHNSMRIARISLMKPK